MASSDLNKVRVYWEGFVGKTNHMDLPSGKAGRFTEKLHLLFDSTSIGITVYIGGTRTDSFVWSEAGFIVVLFSPNGTEAFFSHDVRRIPNHAAVSAQKKSHIAH